MAIKNTIIESKNFFFKYATGSHFFLLLFPLVEPYETLMVNDDGGPFSIS